MTTIHGNEGKVNIATDELKVQSFDLNITEPGADDTAIGDAWTSTLGGAPKSWSVTLTCTGKKADPAQDALVVGAEVVVELYSSGDASGEKYYSGSGRVETVDQTQNFSDAVSKTFTVIGNGALSEDTVTP